MRRLYKTFTFKVFVSFLSVILCCIIVICTVAGHITSDILKKNNYATANGLMNQVSYFYDSRFFELQKILDNITSGSAYLHLMKSGYYEGSSSGYYMDISRLLNSMQDTKNSYIDYIDSIYYYNKKHDLELYVMKKGPVKEIDGSRLLESVSDTGLLQFGWISAHDETVFRTQDPRKVISLYRYTAGTLFCINLSVEIFQKELDYSVFGEDCYLTLVGSHSSMVSRPFDNSYQLEEGTALPGRSGEWEKRFNSSEKQLWVTSVALESNGWTVAAVMPEDYLRKESGRIYQTVFLWAGLILLAAACLAYLISRSVTGPVSFIIKQMQKVQEDNLEVDFSLKDKESELGVMAENLNQMEQRMIDLIEQAKEQERLHRRLEIAVLQAQINPHFLYNTLASAQGLIHERDNKKAEYLLEMLVVFFRTGLGRGSSKVTLSDELRHVGSYLEIQQMRYGDCFSYEIEAAEELQNAEVMKLSVQPLIENAVYHGAKERPEHTFILISARSEGGKLKICVFDDGAGIARERLAEVRDEIGKPFGKGNSSVTYGLRNVNQRLRLEYGAEYGLELDSVEGEYTMVTMWLPYIVKGGFYENTDSRG